MQNVTILSLNFRILRISSIGLSLGFFGGARAVYIFFLVQFTMFTMFVFMRKNFEYDKFNIKFTCILFSAESYI